MFGKNKTPGQIQLPGRVVNVLGDGGCFFRAVAHELHRQGVAPGITHEQVRARAVNYLDQHREMLRDKPPELNGQIVPPERYLQAMALAVTYAEGHVIDAVALEFNVRLHVHEIRGNKVHDIHINKSYFAKRPAIALVRENLHYQAIELGVSPQAVNPEALFLKRPLPKNLVRAAAGGGAVELSSPRSLSPRKSRASSGGERAPIVMVNASEFQASNMPHDLFGKGAEQYQRYFRVLTPLAEASTSTLTVTDYTVSLAQQYLRFFDSWVLENKALQANLRHAAYLWAYLEATNPDNQSIVVTSVESVEGAAASTPRYIAKTHKSIERCLTSGNDLLTTLQIAREDFYKDGSDLRRSQRTLSPFFEFLIVYAKLQKQAKDKKVDTPLILAALQLCYAIFDADHRLTKDIIVAHPVTSDVAEKMQRVASILAPFAEQSRGFQAPFGEVSGIQLELTKIIQSLPASITVDALTRATEALWQKFHPPTTEAVSAASSSGYDTLFANPIAGAFSDALEKISDRGESLTPLEGRLKDAIGLEIALVERVHNTIPADFIDKVTGQYFILHKAEEFPNKPWHLYEVLLTLSQVVADDQQEGLVVLLEAINTERKNFTVVALEKIMASLANAIADLDVSKFSEQDRAILRAILSFGVVCPNAPSEREKAQYLIQTFSQIPDIILTTLESLLGKGFCTRNKITAESIRAVYQPLTTRQVAGVVPQYDATPDFYQPLMADQLPVTPTVTEQLISAAVDLAVLKKIEVMTISGGELSREDLRQLSKLFCGKMPPSLDALKIVGDCVLPGFKKDVQTAFLYVCFNSIVKSEALAQLITDTIGQDSSFKPRFDKEDQSRGIQVPLTFQATQQSAQVVITKIKQLTVYKPQDLRPAAVFVAASALGTGLAYAAYKTSLNTVTQRFHIGEWSVSGTDLAVSGVFATAAIVGMAADSLYRHLRPEGEYELARIRQQEDYQSTCFSQWCSRMFFCFAVVLWAYNIVTTSSLDFSQDVIERVGYNRGIDLLQASGYVSAILGTMAEVAAFHYWRVNANTNPNPSTRSCALLFRRFRGPVTGDPLLASDTGQSFEMVRTSVSPSGAAYGPWPQHGDAVSATTITVVVEGKADGDVVSTPTRDPRERYVEMPATPGSPDRMMSGDSSVVRTLSFHDTPKDKHSACAIQ